MKLGRRGVLRGAAGISVALPWLEAFAQRQTPKLVLLFSANGTLHEKWTPSDDTKPTSSPILAPLTGFDRELVVVKNLDLTSATTLGPGDAHGKGIAHLWTGAEMVGHPAGPAPWWAGGPSIDQLAAPVLSEGAPLASLELGVQVNTARVWDRMIAKGPGRPLPPEERPAAAFDRLFGGDAVSPEERERRARRKRSVLDFVRESLGQTRAQLGVEDRRRLEAHAESVREVERRLERLAQAKCTPGARPPELSGVDPNQFQAIGRAQMDLIALALSCDLTRVASLQWSYSTSAVVFDWLGCTVEHHELSHRADEDLDAKKQLEAICTWYSGEVAYLVGLLQSRGLLDSTVVAWGNELGVGNTHSHVGTPFVLAGGRSLGVKVGSVVDAQHRAHNDLLVAILKAVGLPTTSVGAASLNRGALPGIVG